MTWAHYLLQVNIYLVIFYAFYKLLLDKETYFMLNRIYLIGAGLLSLAIPFIQPEWLGRQTATQQVSVGIDQLNLLMMQVTTAPAQEEAFNWGQWLAVLYSAGIVFFAVRLTWQLLRVKQLIRAKPEGSAFSFFQTKVIDQQLPGIATIRQHEEVHIRQLHTVDVLFFEVLAILAWCNPISYAYKISIRNIHEYLADEVAAGIQGDKEAYAMLLLHKAFGIDQNRLTNNFFNQSLLKKRILMLSKERSRKTAVLKYGLFLPLFAITLLFSSATIRSNEKLIAVTEKITAPDLLLTIVPENEADRPQEDKDGSSPVDNDPEKVAAQVDNTRQDTIKPSFKGGMEEFYKYLAKECKYPKEDQDNNISGKVMLSFIVEPTGKLSEIKVTKGVSPTIDAEAVRLMQQSPDWVPGSVGNTPVRVQFDMPISFSLSDDKEEKATTIKSTNQDEHNNSLSNHNNTTNRTASTINPNVTLRIQDKALYIIDGVRSYNNEIRKLNPDQVVEMNVINDENALKTYGAEGKKGVVLVTTRKNKKYKGTVSKVMIIGNPKTNKLKDNKHPMFFVDDVRIYGNALETVNPDDIEAINVVKDGMTERYGDDAKDGVVFITTRKNKDAKPTNKATSIKGSGTSAN